MVRGQTELRPETDKQEVRLYNNIKINQFQGKCLYARGLK